MPRQDGSGLSRRTQAAPLAKGTAACPWVLLSECAQSLLSHRFHSRFTAVLPSLFKPSLFILGMEMLKHDCDGDWVDRSHSRRISSPRSLIFPRTLRLHSWVSSRVVLDMFSKTNVKETLQQFSSSVLMFAIKGSRETHFLHVLSPSHPHNVNFVASTVVISRLPSMYTVCKKRWTPNLWHFSSAFHRFELFLPTCQRKSATYRKRFLW